LASAVVLLVVGGIVGGLVISQRSGAVRTIAWAQVPGLQTGPAPWNSGSATLAERLPPAGLHPLTMEGAVIHVHQHLDVFVNGRKVPVPALIGIDPVDNFLTEIHTHDASGIIHVESPTQRTFTLGQLFCEWGVKLTRTCLGPYRGTIAWWVNGRRMSGDPAQLVLAAHQEIVVAAGTPPSHVPHGYPFPAGL